MTNCPILLQTPEFISASKIAGSFSAPWKSSLHMHKYTEFFFIQDGQGEFLIDNKIFQASKGAIIIYNPLTEHQEISSKHNLLSGLSVMFKNLHIVGKEIGFIINPDDTPIINLQDSYSIMNTFFLQMFNEYYIQTPEHIELNSSLLQSVIIMVCRNMD
ncbi:MAG: cupin domain-containing protein, partial [Ruminiclostridium sp.]